MALTERRRCTITLETGKKYARGSQERGNTIHLKAGSFRQNQEVLHMATLMTGGIQRSNKQKNPVHHFLIIRLGSFSLHILLPFLRQGFWPHQIRHWELQKRTSGNRTGIGKQQFAREHECLATSFCSCWCGRKIDWELGGSKLYSSSSSDTVDQTFGKTLTGVT